MVYYLVENESLLCLSPTSDTRPSTLVPQAVALEHFSRKTFSTTRRRRRLGDQKK